MHGFELIRYNKERIALRPWTARSAVEAAGLYGVMTQWSIPISDAFGVEPCKRISWRRISSIRNTGGNLYMTSILIWAFFEHDLPHAPKQLKGNTNTLISPLLCSELGTIVRCGGNDIENKLLFLVQEPSF